MKLDSLSHYQKRIITHYLALRFANLLQICCKFHFQKLESLDFTGLLDNCSNTTRTSCSTTFTLSDLGVGVSFWCIFVWFVAKIGVFFAWFLWISEILLSYCYHKIILISLLSFPILCCAKKYMILREHSKSITTT